MTDDIVRRRWSSSDHVAILKWNRSNGYGKFEGWNDVPYSDTAFDLRERWGSWIIWFWREMDKILVDKYKYPHDIANAEYLGDRVISWRSFWNWNINVVFLFLVSHTTIRFHIPQCFPFDLLLSAVCLIAPNNLLEQMIGWLKLKRVYYTYYIRIRR